MVMATTLLKKDYKIIWTSAKNPERVIIEVDKKTLDDLTSQRRRNTWDISLSDYIKSGEINNSENISRDFHNVDDLISSMK